MTYYERSDPSMLNEIGGRRQVGDSCAVQTPAR